MILMDDHPKQERLKFSWKYEKFIYDYVYWQEAISLHH